MERSRRDDRDDDRRPSRGRDDDDRGSRRASSRDDEPRGRGRDDRDDDRRPSRDRDDDRRSSRDRDDDRGSRRSSRDRDDDRGSRGGSGSGRGYEYRARTADEVKRRASKGANDFDKLIDPSIPGWSPKDGDNRIRIVPPTWEKADHYAYDIWVHYGVGADRQSYLDLDKMKGEPDPITEELARMKNERDPDEEFIKEHSSKRRAGIYLIDRDDEKAGVQFWAMPWTIDRDITTVSVDKDTGEVLQIDNPKDGYDVMFTKTGKGVGTKYTGVSIARRSSPLGKEEWLDFAVDNPIPEKLLYFPYDHIAKAWGGASSQKDRSRDDDRDDDRRPSRDRDRDDDRRSSRDEPARGRGRDREEPSRSDDKAPTWREVHEMTARELDDLIEAERLNIDPRDAKDDDDLADWICDEMGIEKEPEPERGRRREPDPEPEPRGRRREADDEPPARERRREADPEDRMTQMRRRRED